MSLFGRVAVTLENDALTVLEVHEALAKASPFRGVFHS
jgi:hypothetical protein